MTNPILGIQLYTLRDYCQNAKDFDEILNYLSDLGVKDVQISAIGDIPSNIQNDILKKNNMKVCVTHKPFERFLNDTQNLIDEHKIIECDALGIGAPTEEYRNTKDNVDNFISKVNSFLPKLKEQGLTFNYHNHDFEFKLLENDVTMFDYLIENTDPDSFYFILDVAWIHYAGKNPCDYIKKLKDRIKVCHFKDYDIIDGKRTFVTLGNGKVNLEDCYKTCKEVGIPYIMYEQDCDWIDNDPKKATKISWDYMQKLSNN